MSQHGCDTHATDPLAHLAVSTTSMAEAAWYVDRIAHKYASGRWLATGGGGYGVYNVVPRAWASVWLAQAHRNPPDRIPDGWRERWAAEAARYGIAELPHTIREELPSTMIDAANEITRHTMANIRECLVPKLILTTVAAGGWGPLDSSRTDEDRVSSLGSAPEPVGTITILDAPSPEALERLTYAPRLIANLSRPRRRRWSRPVRST